MKRFLSIITVLTFATLLGGCAYRLGDVKPSALEGINTLYVPNFKNLTLEPRISVLTTSEVIKQLQRDGTFIIGRDEDADASLIGRITRIERIQARAARFNSLASLEIELIMHVKYKLVVKGDGEALTEGTVIERTNYFIGSNLQLAERQAMSIAAERVARTMVSRIAEGW